jgi:3-dehydroquinate dehydratase-1
MGFVWWMVVVAASPSAPGVTAAARAGARTTIVSHHDFARTPPLEQLVRVADACRAAGGDIAKVATLVHDEGDRDTLLALLARQPEATCVIGMGDAVPDLRVTLPAHGSLLAYGYLERPTAPGQISAAEMDRRLRAACPPYAARRGGG